MSRVLEGYTPVSSGVSFGDLAKAGLDSLRTGLSVSSNVAKAQRESQVALNYRVPGLNNGSLSAARNPVYISAEKVAPAGDPDVVVDSDSPYYDLGSLNGFTRDANGKVGFADKNFQAAMDMINQISKANNEWSAAQAQKQMDFQKMMSDTAHQREVADLQKAGLNPVLSAGGSGASTPVGSMGQTDDSNTRLIAELAYSAIDALGMSAAAYAGGSGGSSRNTSKNSDSLFGRLSDAYASNKLVKKVVDAGLGAAQYAIGGLALAKGKGAMAAAKGVGRLLV